MPNLRLGSETALKNSTVVFSGGTLNLNGYNPVFGGLASTTALATGSRHLTVGGNNENTSYHGQLSGSGGSHLVKTGTGTLSLRGDNNFLGTFVLENGTLDILNNNSLNNSPSTQKSTSTPVN